MGAYELVEKLNSLRKTVLINKYFPLIAYMTALLFCIPAQIQGGKSAYVISWSLLGIATVLVIHVCKDSDKVKREYKKLYKDTFVKTMIESMLDDAFYSWGRGFNQMDVATFGLVKLGNKFKSEDYLCGSYKGVSFSQADVSSWTEVVINDEEVHEVYFSGRMFEFTFTGKSVQNVKVISHSYNGGLSLGDEIIDLESFSFNKAFDVYSPDSVEAFYILTPQVMERLKRIQEKYDKIGFRFGQGRLCVAISGLNAFEPDCKKKISYPEEYERVKKEVQVVIDIIEMIGLMQEEV